MEPTKKLYFRRELSELKKKQPCSDKSSSYILRNGTF